MTVENTNTARESVDEWFAAESRRLWLFIRSRIGEDSSSDDLAQQVYLKAAVGDFSPGTNLNAWIYAIAKNTILDHFRRKKRQACSLDGLDTAADSEDVLVSLVRNDEDQELRRNLDHCLSNLSTDELNVVNARLTGSSHEAIASQYSWPSANRSEKTFFRAKRKLRTCLESKGATDEGV